MRNLFHVFVHKVNVSFQITGWNLYKNSEQLKKLNFENCLIGKKGQRGQQTEIMYRKGDMEMGKQTAWEEIDKKSSEIFTASDEIWGCAETAFTEEKSMKILCDVLKAEGFTVETGLADVKTAFKGTFGSGKPVIGILGEFDALSGLDQEAGATEKIVVHDFRLLSTLPFHFPIRQLSKFNFRVVLNFYMNPNQLSIIILSHPSMRNLFHVLCLK